MHAGSFTRLKPLTTVGTRQPASTGAYHQTRELSIALLAGGSSPGHGTYPAGMAQQVFSLSHAARTEDRQGGDGAETRHWFVLDVAPGMGLRAGEKVRFARGTARTSPWCAVEHRVIDCGIPLPFHRGGSEVVIMIAACDRRDAWVGPSSRPETITMRAVVGLAVLPLERNGALIRVHAAVCSKTT